MSRKKKTPAKKPSPKKSQPASTTGNKQAGKQAGQQSPSWLSRFFSGSVDWARYLWATVTALLIAAMLFEPTMLWCLSVGLWMVAETEFIGLWMVAAGYVLACVPWAFGLLIATGKFWKSLTHALWLGLLYAGLGYLFLDHILGVTGIAA